MAKVIAVTGKGGTGKTVVAALILKYLKEHSSAPILAIDADPDANLGTVLGMPVETTIGDLREHTRKEIQKLPAGLSKSVYIEAGLHELIVESEKVDLITMGRSEGPGCYCYINSLLRKFADDIQSSYEWVVMDNEAGMEHLSRRTASRVDHLIVVVNENPLSVHCAERIAGLLADVKNEISHKYMLANGMEEARAKKLKGKAVELEMEFLGAIPFDPAVHQSILSGQSLFKLDQTPATAKIAKIMKKLAGEETCKSRK